MIAPTFVNIPAAVAAAAGSKVEIGGQNLYWAKEGAFTGEVSAPMLTAVGAKWVIIGHSERRQYFGETDETVYQKTVAALEARAEPHRVRRRAAGRARSGQDRAGASGAVARRAWASSARNQIEKIAIAYEPVWAIGTGKTATPEMAQEAHRYIRSMVARQFGFGPANQSAFSTAAA